MNDIISTITGRRTIRKYRAEQIADDELQAILDAGLHAPNAGGRQSAVIVACQDPEINDELGRINRGVQFNISTPPNIEMGRVSHEQPSIVDDGSIKSAFYSAPTVLTLFARKGVYNLTGDCFAAAQNMIIAAHSLGIGSCMVARAIETFETGRGREIQKEWGVGEEYEARVHVTLGYTDGGAPKYKPRANGRVIRV